MSGGIVQGGDAATQLRSRGLQVTAQRVAVLDAVAAHPHITADDIGALVRRSIGTISRQAVYDALATLTEHDLVRRIQPAGAAARYEDRVGDNHHHLICRACNRMVDVDCAVGAVPCLTPSDDAGFDVDEAEVTFWGLCPDCAGAAAVPTTAPHDHDHHHDHHHHDHHDHHPPATGEAAT